MFSELLEVQRDNIEQEMKDYSGPKLRSDLKFIYLENVLLGCGIRY